MARRLFLFVSLLLTALPAVTGSAAAAGSRQGPAVTMATSVWPQPDYSGARTRWNPFEHVLSPANVSKLVLKWRGPFGTPSINNGLLYDVGTGGHVQARSIRTGTLRWHSPATGLFGPLSTTATRVCTPGAEPGSVACIDARTGEPAWTRAGLNDTLSFAHITIGDAVYAYAQGDPDFPGLFAALELDTGATRWIYDADVSPTVAAAGGSAYLLDSVVGSGGGPPEYSSILKVNAATGAVVWGRNYDVLSSLAARGGMLFAIGPNLAMGIDAATGAVEWATGLHLGRSYGAITLAVDDSAVYLHTGRDQVIVLDAATGALIWKARPSESSPLTSPAVANGVLYVTNASGLLAFRASTGSVLLRYRLRSPSSPVVAARQVYLTNADGVHVLGLPD